MTQLSRRWIYLFVVLLVIALVTPLGAQELRGRVTGTVRDNTGGVLPGVSVTLSGEAMIQAQTTVTGSNGNYGYPSVPPGVYNMDFELSGFRTVRREEIRVNLNVTLTINTEMPLAGVQETLTITGESPVVDIKTTTTAVNFTSELLEDIPNARDIWAAMAQAPGFQMNGYDVGGSHAGTQTGYATYGFRSQNRTLLEGINVTEGTGGNAGYFDYGSFEEYQLGGAGNQVETHGIGAFHNLTVTSGGDRFKANVYYDFISSGMVSDNVPSEFLPGGSGERDGFSAPSGGVDRGNPTEGQYDFNAGVGGPIVREKAWWYFSYRKNSQNKFVFGLPDPAHTELINYSIKGNYQINDKNQIIGFWNRRTKLQSERNLGLTVPINAAWWQGSVNKPWKLEWTSVLSQAAFLDVQYSGWINEFPLYPTQTQSQSVEGVEIGHFDQATGQYSNAAYSFYRLRDTNKPQVTGSLSYYVDDAKGTHSIKLGTEWYRERLGVTRFQPGNQFYRDRDGLSEDVDIYNTPNRGTNDSKLFSLWATDSWTLNNRLTLNLGLRFDRYTLGWPEQSINPEIEGFPFEPVTTPATTTNILQGLSPRLGLAWDVRGDGRTVAKAFWGRFYSNPSTGFVDDANPVGILRLRYTFNDMDGNGVLTAGPCGNLFCSPELGNFQRSLDGAGSRQVDPDLLYEYGQEASFSIEHELRPNLSIRANYVHKSVGNGWDEVDLERFDQYTIPFEYSDSGDDNIRGTADDQVISLLDRPAGLGEERLWTNPVKYDGLEPYNRNYDTFEVAFNKRYSDRWMFLTSYMFTKVDEFKNTSQSSTSRLQTIRTSGSYNWEPNLREYFGRQDANYSNFKVVGRYVFPMEIGLSTSYKWQSGYNWARRISARLPNAGTERIHATEISDNRGDNVGIWDLRVDYSFNFGDKGGLTVMADLYNVLNSNPVANFRSFAGSRFREVIALLDPRVFRIGLRFEF